MTFDAKGEGRTNLSLEHSKLKSPVEREGLIAGWSWALDSFKSYVETGQPLPYEQWLAAQKA